jgi:hypothetical protein
MLPPRAPDHRLDALAHRAEMDRHVRRVGDQLPLLVEDRAGEIEPFLDVHGVAGLLQGRAHLLGDRHEEVVEHLEHDGIDRGADRRLPGERHDAGQHQVAGGGELGPPARLDDGGGGRLGDDGGAVDAVAGAQLLAAEHRRLVRDAVAAHADPGERRRRRRVAPRHRGHRPVPACLLGPANRLDRDGLDDLRLARHDEAVALAVRRLEGGEDLGERGRLVGRLEQARPERHDQRRVGPGIAQMEPLQHRDRARRHALGGERPGRLAGEVVRHGAQPRQQPRCQGRLDGPLAQHALVGQPHAVGREHTGQRVQQHPRHAERIGNQAGMLPAGTAEAAERVFRDVVAALDRDLLDGVGHVLDGDPEEALGRRRRIGGTAGGGGDLGGESGEAVLDHGAVERLVAARPEQRREEVRLQLAEHHVAVGDGQRPAAPVAGRPGIGAGGIRSHPEARCRRNAGSSRRRPPRCGSASSARACARRPPASRRPARTRRHSARRRSRCRPCRSR